MPFHRPAHPTPAASEVRVFFVCPIASARATSGAAAGQRRRAAHARRCRANDSIALKIRVKPHVPPVLLDRRPAEGGDAVRYAHTGFTQIAQGLGNDPAALKPGGPTRLEGCERDLDVIFHRVRTPAFE